MLVANTTFRPKAKGEPLSEEVSCHLVASIRAGDPRSKNGGEVSPEPATGKLVLVDLPVNTFAPEYIEFLRESTSSERVARYASEKPDAPIYALPGTRGSNIGKWIISDGGHRLLGAIDRGDADIEALVPAEAAQPRGARRPWEMTRAELSADYGAEWKIPNNCMTPWEGTLPPVGTWRMDPLSGGLEQLKHAPLQGLVISEDEADAVNREDTCQYIRWAKEGRQAPPVSIVKHVKGHWVSINRRRVMAARAAGHQDILAWVSDTDERGRPAPTHESIVEQALNEGKSIPPEVLADYPALVNTRPPLD